MLTAHSFFILLLSIHCAASQELSHVPQCNQPAERGECDDRGFTIKWYYDRYAKRCRQFYYGGCGGNSNRFDSYEDCEQVCHQSQIDGTRRCLQMHDPGACAGNYERWHFDDNSKQCVCGICKSATDLKMVRIKA